MASPDPARLLRGGLRRARTAATRTRIACAEAIASTARDPEARQKLRAQLWPHHRFLPVATPPTPDKLAELSGTQQGRRCFIVGNAPSIDRHDLGLITDDFIFVVNRGYLLASRFAKTPDALVISDAAAFADYGESARRMNFSYKFFSTLAPISATSSNEFIFAMWQMPGMYNNFFQFDITQPLYRSFTVVLYACQIAAAMGFDEIVFIGVDLDFKRTRPHFYKSSPREMAFAERVSQQTAGHMAAGFRCAAEAVARRGGPRLVNAADGGNLDALPRRSFASLFARTPCDGGLRG